MGPYTVLPGTACAAVGPEAGIPDYLNVYYWWAYVHPKAVRVFERQWLVNLILWGNFGRLRDAALAALGDALPGRTLQVACVYGNLTPMLSDSAARGGGRIDVVDVLPVQLSNLRRKLPADAPARLLRMDSTDLNLPDASYDRALMFFLLHEQPEHYRERTIRELFRVVKPGGRIVIVDYAKPRWWHPLRYLWRPLLATLEPFALDLWRQDLTELLAEAPAAEVRASSFFGGLYRKVVVTRGEAETGAERLAA
ncbi:MAG TPA: rhodoquinone biosynthesis methyltransferase RquA [Beijerinckiaceae bacterium]|nr:rhodoquinone biosynthesis methyltransferase RquA [Beijerinckiaceae bacterium]